MAKNKVGLVIIILILIIVVLLGVILYALVAKPTINSYVISKQTEAYNQGVEDAVNFIVKDIDQRGFTQISIGDRIIYLAPVQAPQ